MSNLRTLKIYEKLVQNPSEDNEVLWYEEITEKSVWGIPYYYLVKYNGKYVPLPFFFEGMVWQVLGGPGPVCSDGKLMSEKNRLPRWCVERIGEK